MPCFVRLLGLALLAVATWGCEHLPSGEYAELYIRALDEDGYHDVGAKIYMGSTGQVLTTEISPTAVTLLRKDGWYPNQVLPLVIDAPGYRTAIALVKISRWSHSRADARLNSNNIDIVLMRDPFPWGISRPSRQTPSKPIQ